jgi:hypothetical protein
MSTRWPSKVTDAIKEAAASGMGFTAAFRRLQAGTLYEVREPTLMPQSTFEKHWAAAKREQRRIRSEAPECPTCGQPAPGLAPPPKPEGETLFERIARDIEEEDAEAESSLSGAR